jgi:hypothetical protein
VLEDLGVASRAAEAGWVLLALAVVAACLALGWRGDDRRSFALSVSLMIVAIPVVWLHSFALLIASVAVMKPRLSVAWFMPILFVIGPGTGNGAPWQTAAMLVIMAATLVVALVPSRRRAPSGESLPGAPAPAAASPS